jgi:predicted permease
LGHDIRYSLRRLVRSPLTTTVAILSLALGIGANTAIFSLVNALILRPLPIRRPAELVRLFTFAPANPDSEGGLSLAMYEHIRENQRVFSGLFAWDGQGIVNIEANGVKYAAGGSIVTGGYFSTLGIQPFLGRLITPRDLSPDGGLSAAVAVIGYDCWQRRYQGDPAVVGKSIRVEDRVLTVIGVTPKSFSSLTLETVSDVTVPIGFSSASVTEFRDRRALGLWVFGRLKPGISIERAAAQLEAIWPATLEASLPEGFARIRRDAFLSQRIVTQSASAGTSFLRQKYKYALFVLMAIVALVLLIACANLANLMLALAAQRRHELGIRYALGSGTWRIVREMLTEGLILSAAGAALGVLIAVWASRLLLHTMTGTVGISLDVAPDLRVLSFAVFTSFLTGVLFSAAPAWSLLRKDDLATAINERRRGVHGAGATAKVLISAQVALSVALVMIAGLFVRSLSNLRGADLGFRPDGMLLIQLFPQTGAENQRMPNRAAYYQDLAQRLQALPGVTAVSFSHMGPVLSYEFKNAASVASSQDQPVQAVLEAVGPGFFRLAGMHVLEGREFDWRDSETAQPVAIVSESLARRLFPSVSPIGRTIDFGRHKGLEIAGVVNSASLWTPRSGKPMAVYLALTQAPEYSTAMIDIRIAGDPAGVLPAVRRVIESLGRHVVLRAETLDQRASMLLNTDRIMAMLSSFFACLALLLAAVGLYGLMSYVVSSRTSEIGVRMALGALPGGVLMLVFREAAWLVAMGFVVGIGAALGSSRLISHMVFNTGMSDPRTILLSALILVIVSALACYRPARRASRIDPMTAIRAE